MAQSDPGCDGDVWTNDFEAPVFERYPELEAIKEELTAIWVRIRAALSGSGSAVFGQFQMLRMRSGQLELERRFRVKSG